MLYNNLTKKMGDPFEQIRNIDKQIKEEELAKVNNKPDGDPPAPPVEVPVIVDDAEKERLAAEEAARIEAAAKAAENTAISFVDADEEKFKGKTYDEIIAEKEQIKAEAKQKELLEKAKGNKAGKLVLEAIDRGEDVTKVLTALQTSNPKDFSEKDLFVMTLSEEERQGDIDELFENFNSMPGSVKTALIEGKRKELTAQYEAVLEGLNNRNDKEIEVLMKTVPEGINSRVKSLVGTKIEGIEITPNLAVKIAERAFEDATLSRYRKGGEFDFERLMEDVTGAIMAPAYRQAVAAKAKKEATAEAFEAIHSPDGKGTPTGSAPVKKSKLDEDVEVFNKYMESQNVQFSKKK